MIDSVKIIYGYSFGKIGFGELVERVSALASSYHVDFDLRVTKNSIAVSVYPFKYKDAKEIKETEGAQIMSSLIFIFDHCIVDGVLWSVDMATALPF